MTEILTPPADQKEKVRQAWAGAHAGKVNHISETDYPNRFAVFLVKAVPEDEFDIASMTGFLSTRLEAHRLKLVSMTTDRLTVAVELLPNDEPEDQGKTEPLPDLKTEAGQAVEPTPTPEPSLIAQSNLLLDRLKTLDPETERDAYNAAARAFAALWQPPPKLAGDLLATIEADMQQLRTENANVLKANGILNAEMEKLESENANLLRINEQQSKRLREQVLSGAPLYVPQLGITPEQLRAAKRAGWREYFRWGSGDDLNVWWETCEPDPSQPLDASAEPEVTPSRIIEKAEPVATTIGNGMYRDGQQIRIVTPERVVEPALNQLQRALNNPMTRAVIEKGVEGVMADIDAEARDAFMEAVNRPSEPMVFTLIPGRKETQVDTLPMLTPSVVVPS